MSDINKFTSKEVLNKVLLDSSGNAVEAFSHTTQEALNAALDTTNNRLNVSLAGGTISGDVTISGDLTVNGNGSGNYDEIVDGNLVLTSGSKLGIGMGDATVSYPLHVQDQVDGNYVAYFKNTDSDNGYGVAIDAGDDANVNALQVRTVSGSNLFVVNGAGNATFGGDVNIQTATSDRPILNIENQNADNSPPSIHLYKNSSSPANSDQIGDLSWYAKDDGGAKTRLILFRGFQTNVSASADSSKLSMYTTKNGIETETLTLDDGDATFGGHVIVGSTISTSSDTSLQIGDSGDTHLRIGEDANNNARMTWDASENSLEFHLTDSSTARSNVLVLDSTGNVIVGQTSGQQKLEVHGGGIRINGNITAPSSGVSGALIDYYGSDTRFWSRGADASTVGSFKFIGLENDGGNQSTQLEIDSSGNATFAGNVTLDTAHLNLDSGYELQWNTALTKITGGDTYLVFDVNNSERMRINSSGNVSIGTSSTLDGGGSKTVLTISDDAQAVLVFEDTGYESSGDGLAMFAYNDGTLTYRTASRSGTTWASSTNRLVIDANSRISLSNNDSGTSNTVFGKLAGNALDSGGQHNLCIGEESGHDITTGDNNVSVGSYSNDKVSTNGDNTAIGYEAHRGDGGQNTVVGSYAVDHESGQADSIVAVGHQAMRGDLTSGADGAVAVGAFALNALTSGAGNLAIGYQSGDALSTGDYNTAIGYQALSTEDTGDRNTAIGYGALVNANGANNNANTAVGFQSGANVTTGIENTLIGEHAGLYITTGNYNTALGNKALGTIVDGLRNTAIGYGAMKDTDSGTTVDGSDDNTFVGYTAGGGAWVNEDISNIVAVGSSALRGALQTEASGTVAIGKEALYELTEGAGNTAVGYQAMDELTTGDYNTAVGYQALHQIDSGEGNCTAVGYLAGGNLDGGVNNVFVGDNTTVGTANNDNNTIIGSASTGGGSNSTVIGYNTTGQGANSVTLGNASVTDVYMAQDKGATVHCAQTVVTEGINFPDDASSNPAGDVNTLDSYEEGTWTPVITDGSNNATMSGTYNAGLYTKVGRVVHLTANIVTTSLGSVSGDIKISGLPFTAKNAFGALNGTGIATSSGLAITAGHSVSAQIAINTTTAGLNVSDATTGTTAMQHSEWTDDGNINFSMTYFV